MKAYELRIGNYNLFDGRLDTISDGYDIDHVKHDTEGRHQPIPITEEILLDLGFESNPYQDRYEKNGVNIHCKKSGRRTELWIVGSPHIKHIHQLQNYYFARKNEELEL